MAAYYNEIDPFAAQWLRNLIAAGHIAPGDVDERSIEDVTPDDLQNYTQCHFFAGIGVWSYSLRRAGWPDKKPVWTGSCPCQPFSAAGKKSGFDDKRHLWPTWFRLISQCRPGIVFGEQVASKYGLAWLDHVHLDMETAEYAFAAIDLCAAGVGAPHIRQRLFWVADADGMGRFGRGGSSYSNESSQSVTPEGCRSPSGMAHCHNHRQQSGTRTGCGCECATAGDDTRRSGKISHLADAQRTGFRSPSPECISAHQYEHQASVDVSACGRTGRALQVNGIWRDADWLFCRDGNWRPVEPGTFPLAYGVANRVGRLRAYGNAINAEVATTFISAYMDAVQ